MSESNGDMCSLVDDLTLLLIQSGIDAVTAKSKIALILDDYEIRRKEVDIVPYTGDGNERLIQRFIVAKKVAGCTQRTLHHYYRELRTALLSIGKDCVAVSSQDVMVLIARMLQRGCSKCYCDDVRLVLSTFFRWMQREEIISQNPMDKVERIRYRSEKEKAYSSEDIERMRIQLRTWREKAIFELLLSTGCRAAELVSIKITDIEDDHIQVFGKGEKYRTVYLNSRAKITLEKYLAERKDTNPYLFFGSVQNFLHKLQASGHEVKKRVDLPMWYVSHPDLIDPVKPMNQGSLKDMLKRIGRLSGVENVHPHRFRRTCATMALKKGMPIELVSKMLGHESIATTQIYLDIAEDDLKNAHQKYVN